MSIVNIAKKQYEQKGEPKVLRLESLLPNALAWLTGRPRYKVVAGVDFEWSSNLWTHNFFRALEVVFWAGGLSEKYGDRIYPSIATSYIDGEVITQAFTVEATIALFEVAIRESLATFKLPKWKKVYVPQLAFAGMPTMESLLRVPYLFAIATDATSYDYNGCSSNSITVSHTNTGSNLLLFESAHGWTSGTNEVTGITYNGSAASLVVNDTATSTNTSLYKSGSPSTGAHNIVVSLSGSALCWAVLGVSYTGASSTIDSSSSGHVNSNQVNLTTSTTVVASNCWVVGGWTNNGCVGVAGTSSTQRKLGNNSVQFLDSNGTVSTGSQSLQGACSSGSAQWGSVMASIAPQTSTTYNQTCASTGSGVAVVLKQLPKTISATSSGVAVVTKGLSKTLTSTANGVANAYKGLSMALSVTALGVVSVSASRAYLQICSAVASGIAVVSTKMVWGKAISASATGVASLSKSLALARTLAVSASGVAVVTAQRAKIISAIATGVVSVTKLAGKRISAVGIGIANVAKRDGWKRGAKDQGTWTPTPKG